MTDELEDISPEGAEPDADGEGDGESELLEVVDVGNDQTTEARSEQVSVPDRLPLLPIRNAVAFPGTVMPLEISREKSRRVLDLALNQSRMIAVVAQRSAAVEDPTLDDLYRVGTACVILKMLKAPGGGDTIIVHGLVRVGVEELVKDSEYLEAKVHARYDPQETTGEQRALVHTLRSAADRIIELSPNVPPEVRDVLAGIRSSAGLADFLASNLSLSLVHKQELLETFDVTERLRKVNLAVAAQLDVLELSNKIQTQVRDQVDKSQREYYLREQMKAIQQELGDEERSTETLDNLRQRIAAAKMPAAAEAEARREVDRLQRIPQASPEYSMALDYVEWLAELPWSIGTEDNLDLNRAEQILEEDHYGLKKIKKRIVEFLAVRTLKKDSHGPILCLAGPPGVGKTSLGQSIARAMGRKFIRISLGGVHDEATIRGHRRTYIGAMPGRILREIRRAGSNNPLFMLDEVDKIGEDVRGDPMSALLEVLDPAQNSTFSDHYLAVPFDLSRVLFITTANYMSAIEPALRDRMEVIELAGYTQFEKLQIAERYLVPRQLGENGLSAEQLTFQREAISLIIADYTREAGVRTLERKIGAICRSRAASVVRGESTSATVDEAGVRAVLGAREFESEPAAVLPVPGVVTGLAFTPVGGDILFIEASLMDGTGQLRLTGQLGDVMRESAIAASSIIRSKAREWRVPRRAFDRIDLHVHVPAGATPKDGPSAGLAILTAMLSVLTNAAVDPNIGMTGEITLSGRILPIGGVREKVLAAHRAGLKTVILPSRNEQDLDEVPQEVRDQIRFVFVKSIDEAIATVFAEASAKGGIVKPMHGKRGDTSKRRGVKRRSTTSVKRTRAQAKVRGRGTGKAGVAPRNRRTAAASSGFRTSSSGNREQAADPIRQRD